MTLKIEAKYVYVVKALSTPGGEPQVDEVAVIDGDKVTGPRAERIRTVLVEEGWPGRSPDEILNGNYLWAEKMPRAMAGK